jgi:PAS domain S-box-containing protein
MILTRGSVAALPHDLPVRILEGSPDAILICDHAGTVRYWNAAAERVFGFRVTDTLGVSMNLIIPERLRARHWAGWKATMRTGDTHYGEGQLLAVPALHKDGREISIEFSIQLVRNADSRIEWVVAIIRDVTERYTREKAVRTRLKALEDHGSDPTVVREGGTSPTLAGVDVVATDG